MNLKNEKMRSVCCDFVLVVCVGRGGGGGAELAATVYTGAKHNWDNTSNYSQEWLHGICYFLDLWPQKKK